MYPFRIRVTDPEEIKVFTIVSKYRAFETKPNLTKSIGHKIPRTIKRDGVRIKDGVVAITNPKIILDMKPAYGRKKGYDFIFKSKF